MLCCLIMAGGKGTRFWPMSTNEKPKQFLNIIDDRTMLQLTVDRMKKMLPIERIFIVSGELYKNLIKEQLPDLPEKNIIIEPIGRNTAPCILLSSLYIKQIYENANVAVLPSDHIINDENKFLKSLELANDYLENKESESIVTIGITPDRPETGYGYIKCDKVTEDEICDVEKFVEKPNLETATKYLEDGNYLWNAGMFIFNIEHMLKELKNNFSQAYETLSVLPNITSDKYYESLKENYEKCESISIDYAVMEKSKSIKVIPTDFGWDDIGSWKSLKRYIEPDKNWNYSKGDNEFIESKNNIVYAGNKKIILYGIDDIFCIDSENTLIIGKNSKLDTVHELRNR